MNDEVTLWLPDYWPPSLNQVVNAHWSKNRKHKQKAKDRLYVASLQSCGRVPIFVGPAKVRICRLFQGRKQAFDPDNLMGSVKPLVDAMRAPKLNVNQRGRGTEGGIGIILDDDPEALDLDVDQVRAKFLTTTNIVTVITVTGERQI